MYSRKYHKHEMMSIYRKKRKASLAIYIFKYDVCCPWAVLKLVEMSLINSNQTFVS